MITKIKISHILLIDDESLMLSTLEKALIMEGFKVTTFLSAEKAMEYLVVSPRNNSLFPDLIIVDYVLEGMSGLSFIGEVKKYFEKIRVILMSGHMDKLSQTKAEATDIDMFMSKPISIAELLQSIGELEGIFKK